MDRRAISSFPKNTKLALRQSRLDHVRERQTGHLAVTLGFVMANGVLFWVFLEI